MSPAEIERAVLNAESQLDRARAVLLNIVTFTGAHDKNLLPWMVQHAQQVNDALDNVQSYVTDLENAASKRASEDEK